MSSSSALRQVDRGRSDERELQAGVLRLGALLGWDASVVARFAEIVTGREWTRCGRDQLLDVLAAYAALTHRVRAAQARLPGASGACRGGRAAERGHHSQCAAGAHDAVEW